MQSEFKMHRKLRLTTHFYSGFKRSQRKLTSDSCLAIYKLMKVINPKSKHTQMHAHTQMWTLRWLIPWWNFSSLHLFPFHPSHSPSRIIYLTGKGLKWDPGHWQVLQCLYFSLYMYLHRCWSLLMKAATTITQENLKQGQKTHADSNPKCRVIIFLKTLRSWKAMTPDL